MLQARVRCTPLGSTLEVVGKIEDLMLRAVVVSLYDLDLVLEPIQSAASSNPE